MNLYKTKRLAVVLLIAAAIAVGAAFAFSGLTEASAAENYADAVGGTYEGYTEAPVDNWYNDSLPVSDGARITVLTHGLMQSAAGWSNNAEKSGTPDYSYEFAYDNNSLIERLRAEAGGANVYWAKTDENGTDFHLMELKVMSQLQAYRQDELQKIRRITAEDMSKHIIIVFQATALAANDTNDIVYKELRTMLNRIVCDAAYLAGGVYPKVNLIGHSRGGLTNMQYAQEHPVFIDSIFSLGTPYFGSNFGKINYFADMLGMLGNAGFESIQNQNFQKELSETWNNNYETRYKHINAYAMAGYSSLKFYEELKDMGKLQFGNPTGIELMLQVMSKAGTDGYVSLLTALTTTIAVLEGDAGIEPTSPDITFSAFYNVVLGGGTSPVYIVDDLMVSVASQNGVQSDTWFYKGFIRPARLFNQVSNSDIGKVSSDLPPIVHNLEARDPILHDRILNNINLSSSSGVQYKIIFDSNGGTSCSIIKAIKGTTIIFPEPTKTGYNGNWKNTLGNTVNFGYSYIVTGNETFTAQWFEDHYYLYTCAEDTGGNYINNANADAFDKKVTIYYNQKITLIAPAIAKYTFVKWKLEISYPRNLISKNENYSTSKQIIFTNITELYGVNIHFTAVYKKDSCVAEGTLITLADGTQVPVESLKSNERLLVWNLDTGDFDTAPILFIDADFRKEYEVINLFFSDGTIVKVIDEHAFWDIGLNRYIFLKNDAAQYISHWFYKQIVNADGNMAMIETQLIAVTLETEFTSAWSPVTFGHLSYYVNGMLSMPGATEGLINIFDVDSETMRIEQEGKHSDIEEYGLFTYEEFAGIINIPEEIFEAFNIKYLKVSIGKGLINFETLILLIESYREFFG